MKKIILSLCFLPFAAFAQQKFILKGKLTPSSVPAKAFLYYPLNGENRIDSTVIIGGAFTFSGTLSDVVQAHIKIKRAGVNAKRLPSDLLSFFLEPGNIMVVSKNDSVSNAQIAGSVVNDDAAKCKAMANQIRAKAIPIMAKYKSGTPEQLKDEAYTESFNVKLKVLDDEIKKIHPDFIAANRDAHYSLILFKNLVNVEANPDHAAKEFAKFSARLKATALGQLIQQSINGVKLSALGQKAMDFTQNDVNGKPVKLSDFKGKYVLIDFWASWCGPCRQENPNVVKVYEKYKDKNFTVLGVSLDNPGQKAAWLQAIKEDGLNWSQVSDLKGGNNQVALMYNVKSIPSNFLIGPDGKILAKNLRGDELEQEIEKLLNDKKSR